MHKTSIARRFATKVLTNKIFLTTCIATPVVYNFLPNTHKYIKTSPFFSTAYASWVPHPDFPAPKTYQDAVRYNDYPPGFTEPLPDYSNQPAASVKKVVAANFEELILDPEKDVFVQFSRDNCTSCHSFARILDGLAFAFRDVPSVSFLEMKGTKNYVPGVLTSEEEVLFPTFKTILPIKYA